jgi:hippurate hydrolase
MPRLGPWPAWILLAAIIPGATAAEPARRDPWIESRLPALVDLYEHLHRHPELSYREVNTARRLAEELKIAGSEVTTGVGGLGVVGLIKNGRGPIVLVRADMDALPVTEETGLPYASTVTDVDDDGDRIGVMHACGHDLHMANLVGTATWLAYHKDHWAGTVVLVGQPAEERGSGAAAMLGDGLYTRFPKPDYALALHVMHDLEAGRVGYRSGPAMAGCTSVGITIKGKGGHGAMPHLAVDPIVLASALVLDLQSIVSREINPVDPAVISVGSIHGGTKSNIIPDEVELQLTLRAFRPEVRAQLIEAIERRATAMAHGHGAPVPEVELGGGIPPTVNTPALVDRVVPALTRALGEANVVAVEPTMISEDFGLYQQGGVPTFMIRLGTVGHERLARRDDDDLPALHSPEFAPEAAPALRTGIRALTAAIVQLLPPSRQTRPGSDPGVAVSAAGLQK